MTNGVIKRQWWRYMGYNLVSMTVIFGLFAIILFSQIYQSLYTPVDEELTHAQERISQSTGFVDQQLHFQFDLPPDRIQFGGPKYLFSPRIQVLVREPDGTISNRQALGHWYWESQVGDMEFSIGKPGEITTLTLPGGSNLRSMVFSQADKLGNNYYIQIVTNVDGEKALVDNFVGLLVACVTVFVLLAVAASYILTQRSMRPLLQAWQRQNEFVENASHELRTPLTVIQNKMESMLVTPQATVLDKADSIAVALGETRRLSKLTADLMTLARADSTQTQLEIQQVNLDELVASVSQPYSELAELEEKTLTLALHCPVELDADKSRLHQLLVILLDNALKYTRTGDSIVISTEARDNRAVIQVQDTGIGIGEENRGQVFDRFFREDKARTRESGGSGLGLSIAKWIVDVHGGSIKTRPNGERGTIMEIKLPF